MKKLILSPYFVKKTLNLSDIIDVIQISNAISKDFEISNIYQQFIEERVFNKILQNNDVWSSNFLKNVNNQLIKDFLEKKNFNLLREITVGSIVKINASKISFPLETSFYGIVLKILKGNKDVAYIVPISFDLESATHKSLIVNSEKSPFRSEVVLRCEFMIPILLDQLINQNTSFDKTFITKVNNFLKKGLIDYDNFYTGIPNYDPLDIRIHERNFFDLLVSNASAETRRFLDTGYSDNREQDEFSNILNFADYVYVGNNLSNNKEISFHQSQIISSYSELKDKKNVA